MIGARQLTAEIHALRAELEGLVRSRSASAGPSVVVEEPAGATAAAADLIDEIGKAIAEAADGAEDLVADHPAIAMGSAFLLGFLIGRGTRGLP